MIIKFSDLADRLHLRLKFINDIAYFIRAIVIFIPTSDRIKVTAFYHAID